MKKYLFTYFNIWHISIINENITDIFKKLQTDQCLKLLPLKPVADEPEDEKDDNFQKELKKLERDKWTGYKKTSPEWFNQNNLKDDVRKTLKMGDLDVSRISQERYAKKNNINFDFDLLKVNIKNKSKKTLQTNLFPPDLEDLFEVFYKIQEIAEVKKMPIPFYLVSGYIYDDSKINYTYGPIINVEVSLSIDKEKKLFQIQKHSKGKVSVNDFFKNDLKKEFSWKPNDMESNWHQKPQYFENYFNKIQKKISADNKQAAINGHTFLMIYYPWSPFERDHFRNLKYALSEK